MVNFFPENMCMFLIPSIPHVICRCNLTLANSTDVKGNIVLCFSITSVFPVAQLYGLATAVIKNGGEGFIFTQQNSDLLVAWQFHAMSIPCVSIDLEVAYKIIQYFR